MTLKVLICGMSRFSLLPKKQKELMLLVCTIDETVYVCIDHIVSKGMIEIKNDEQKTIHSHSFRNSNYEKVDVREGKGDFTVKVSFENEAYIRHVHL